jgi:hypothetical protein
MPDGGQGNKADDMRVFHTRKFGATM